MSKGEPIGFCKTCGSELVETVNESLFRDGECDGCEYQRYRTQPELVEALDYLLQQTVDMDLAHGIELTEGEREARHKAQSAIAKANGRPSAAARAQTGVLQRIVAAIEEMLEDEALQITGNCGDLLLQIAQIANTGIADVRLHRQEDDACSPEQLDSQSALLEAARKVVRSWESGDLAAAVCKLRSAIESFESRA